MLVTFDGVAEFNQYSSSQTSHIELSHPLLSDRLILAELDNKPYENYREGQTRSDGRSLKGSLRLKGDNWKKDIWECNFLATRPQVALFELLLQTQQDSTFQISLTDRWFDGLEVASDVWIDVDRNYLSLVALNQWFRLQFSLREV